MKYVLSTRRIILLATILTAFTLNACQTGIQVDAKFLDTYVGVYKLSIDRNRTIAIVKENNQLIAELSKTEKIPLVFQSDTKFQFKNILDANCEFIIENGRVSKFTANQNGYYEWIKIQ